MDMIIGLLLTIIQIHVSFEDGSQEAVKRLYDFGLGKRAYTYVSEYKRLPVYNFGLGKRTSGQNMYSFGLGKRDQEAVDDMNIEFADKRAKQYDFGLGKRLAGQQYNFGLGKKAMHQYDFGLGKRLAHYNFGLGKRVGKAYGFGLGKKDKMYSFGLGKRNVNVEDEFFNNYDDYQESDPIEEVRRAVGQKFDFGLGKRAAKSKFDFGLGKKATGQNFDFALGKRDYQEDEVQDIDSREFSGFDKDYNEGKMDTKNVETANDLKQTEEKM